VLGEGMALPCRDLVALDLVLLGIESAHILDKAARDLGRQFDGLAEHGPDIGTVAKIANPVTQKAAGIVALRLPVKKLSVYKMYLGPVR
jgi:hypothetical protein